MKEICVIGVGYVGLVTGAGFADLGNRVVCLNRDPEKADNLKKGTIPIYEPGLEEIVRRNIAAGRLFFTTDYAEALKDADLVFVAVGTPTGTEGEADLAYVQAAVEGVADVMTRPVILINKSTVPIGTGDWVAKLVSRRTDIPFSVVSNPEFLREGSAVYDFYNPDRVVLGSTDLKAAEAVADIYRPLNCPILVTDLRTAEMIKYASNAFLATRISFINEMAGSSCGRLWTSTATSGVRCF
jgi:UDPglucose 6-dehydrogenase